MRALAILLLAAFTASGAIITGPLQDISAGTYNTSGVEFWPLTTPTANGTSLVVGPKKSVQPTNGNFSVSLVAGRYLVKFLPTTNTVYIWVPNDSGTYTVANLATNASAVATVDQSPLYKVRISSTDSDQNYLAGKILPGSNVTFSTNATAGTITIASTGGGGSSFDPTRPTNYNGTFVGLATGATNIQAHVQRLPWTTLNKLENGKPVKVLWLGDSLATQDYQNIWRQSFMTNLLSRYGTNGWFGGGYLIPNAWNPSLTGVGNIQQVNDATAIWYEQLWRVTNGFTQVWSALSTGDGFFDADEVSIAYLKTNSLANGTLTIKTVDDGGFTNTIAVINCNGAYSIVETNIAINPARIKLQISASGGADVAFATPGVFWSGGTGVRYGTLGQGGLNNFTKDASWIKALAGYNPDLLLVIDANSEAGAQTTINLITALQTNLPFMDVAYVQMPTSSDDYLNNATGLDAQNARRLIQAFAQTNKNTAYFDNYFYNGSALGYQALTNDSQGIRMVGDGIHPSTTNPTLANFIGRKLYEQLGFQYAAISVAGGTVQTNISYLAVTNAPWLTNSDTRSVYFNGGGLTPLVVNGYINSTGANAGFTFMYRDDVSKFTRMSSKNGAFFKVGTSEAYNYPPDYGIGGLVLSNTGGVLSWDAEVVPSNNWLGFTLGYAYPPDMRATNIEARGVITGNGSGITNVYASNIVSGGQLPLGTVSSGLSSVAGPMLTTNGTTRSYSFDGSALTNLNAASLASGSIPAARLNGVALSSNAISYATLSGITTNTGGWVGGLNMTNPVTGSFVVVTNGGITAQAGAGYNILTNGVVALGTNGAAATVTADGINPSLKVVTASGTFPTLTLTNQSAANAGFWITNGIGGGGAQSALRSAGHVIITAGQGATTYIGNNNNTACLYTDNTSITMAVAATASSTLTANSTLRVKGAATFDTTVTATNGFVTIPTIGAGVALTSQGAYILSSSSQTITLPSAVTNIGKTIWIKNRNVTSTTVNTVSSQTIDGASTYSLPNAYSGRYFISDGANWLTDGVGL